MDLTLYENVHKYVCNMYQNKVKFENCYIIIDLYNNNYNGLKSKI